ncbi:MAG TPA: DUF4142 domain-containing protein [Thermoanaerobaculia bacterium]|nr:DUF4142 domain-containing protein [Thermoanaerobaculia bacterium]
MQKTRFLIPIAVFSLFLGACASMTTADTTPNSDPHIAGIVVNANQGEIDQGNAAAAKASSADVRAFAQMMVSDHTTALAAARDTAARANIMPMDNDTTAALQRTSRETITNVGTYTGRDFDRVYMQSQVDLHQWLLTALDQQLIPLATNRDLKSLLETQRASVAAHLDRARAIRAGL